MTSISDLSYEHQQVVEAMKGQLLIVLINRLGGDVTIPASEVDGTSRFVLNMKLDPEEGGAFTFQVMEKS